MYSISVLAGGCPNGCWPPYGSQALRSSTLRTALHELDPFVRPPVLLGEHASGDQLGWLAGSTAGEVILAPAVAGQIIVPDPVPDSAEATLLRMIGGYRVTQALYVVTKLGIPDLLSDGPKYAEELATRVGARPDFLYRVLRALASIGVLTVDGDARFGLTEVGRLLRNNPEGSMGLTAVFAGEEAYRSWGDLLHSIKTGETAFDHRYGMGHFEYLSRNPDASLTFNRLMAWSARVAGEPLRTYDLGSHQLLVDVGGGSGALIASVLRAHPGLRGVLFDQEAAVVDAPNLLATSGVADRCEIVTGSAFDSIPPGGDVYVMSRVLHDWPDDKALVLLTNCRKSMSPGGVLLLVEGVLPEVAAPPPRLWLDLVMMVMTGGRERTETDWRNLLGKAGFALVSVRPDRPNQDLIEARAI
ncbi:MAG TPA: methyltransferase [Thermoplasmata archaeon]|nr:methyltransferase [Thermoplasmata archaeon]